MERYKKLNIAVLFENAFPVGFAETNRLLSLTKGLKKLDQNIMVYCIRPADRFPEILNLDSEGVVDGVEYIYPSKTTIWPETKFKRVSIYFKGIFLTWKILVNENKKNKIDVVLSYSYSIFINNIFWLFCKLNNISFVYLVDEYPYSVLYPQKYNALYKWYELNRYHKLFDLILVMTTPLMEFYSKLKKGNGKIEIIPMTVEPERFENVLNENLYQKPYFAYAGYLGDDKDGVDILIKAFGIVAKEYDDLLLVLIGYSNNQVHHDNLIQLSKDYNIIDRVIFTGRIHRDEVPRYFCNSIGLLLARPDNIQAKGGFPTKLGEYLATGKPVVVTKVGEIPEYLKDNHNAFLAEPDSAESFALKMIELLRDKDNAYRVGKNGKKLTEEVFNYKVQANHILEILNN